LAIEETIAVEGLAEATSDGHPPRLYQVSTQIHQGPSRWV
jgi:hypothetical protein